jgi:hypothetical protein
VTQWGRNDELRDRKKPRFTRDDEPLPDPKKKRRQRIAMVLLVVFAAGMVALQLRSCRADDETDAALALRE